MASTVVPAGWTTSHSRSQKTVVRSQNGPPGDGRPFLFYCFFCSVVVDRCVVELSVAGVVVPSGFTVAGVDCFVSVWVVVLSVLLACGVGVSPGTTTVVGGGLCWQPVSIPPIISANPARHILNECILLSFRNYSHMQASFGPLLPELNLRGRDTGAQFLKGTGSTYRSHPFQWKYVFYFFTNFCTARLTESAT